MNRCTPQRSSGTWMMTTLSRLYGTLGLYPQQEALGRRAVAESRAAFGERNAHTSDALDALATGLFYQGEYQPAVENFRQALSISRGLGASDAILGDRVSNLAQALEPLASWDEAEALCREALALSERAFGDDHVDVSHVLHRLGGILTHLGRYGEARRHLMRALEIRRRHYGPNHGRVASTLQQLSFLSGREGDPIAAERLARQALRIRRVIYEHGHPTIADSLDQIAGHLENRGHLVEAEALYLQALDVRRRYLGDDHLEVANLRNNLAINRARRGDYAGALELMEQVLPVWRRSLGEGHSQVGMGYASLGAMRREVGDLAGAEAALPLLEEALSIRVAGLSAEDGRVAEASLWLGIARSRLGDAAAGRQLIAQANAKLVEAWGAEHRWARRAARELER